MVLERILNGGNDELYKFDRPPAETDCLSCRIMGIQLSTSQYSAKELTLSQGQLHLSVWVHTHTLLGQEIYRLREKQSSSANHNTDTARAKPASSLCLQLSSARDFIDLSTKYCQRAVGYASLS